MRLAYATPYDASNVLRWSGLGYYIGRAVERGGISLDYVSLSGPGLTDRLVAKAGSRIFLGRSAANRRPAYARRLGVELGKRLSSQHSGVLSPGTLPFARLEPGVPAISWADATFNAMVDFYPDYVNLVPWTLRDGAALEQSALRRCSAAIYASDWAARSARDDYGIDPSKIHVIPFGANLLRTPTDAEVSGYIAERPQDRCRLLFPGVEWERKGGPIAEAATAELNARGIDSELVVVGCRPPRERPYMRVVGFLDKRRDETRLAQLYASSHFIILPSRAECFGAVFSEGSAFGVPSVASDVGGIPSAVRDGINGHLLPVEAGARDYADLIERALGDYEPLARSARREFVERLSWDVGGNKAAEIIRRVTSTHGSSA